MSVIVCGFYTPDYAHWLPALEASLALHGNACDFVRTERVNGGWEANTMRKAAEVAKAMERHPDKVIVWLDVDCVVRGNLTPLANLAGDVAVYMRARLRKAGGYKMHCITRTIVLKPTHGARAFVDTWAAHSARARYGDVDQTTFLMAMGEATDTSFQPLEWKWSAIKGDPDGIILHDQASRDAPKIASLGRLLHRVGILG